MTLAVCSSCGGEKFGAFVACPSCGTQPVTPIEKARSLILSDHHLSPDELREAGRKIATGTPIRIDSVPVVIYVDQILQETYFWEHVTPEGRLKCLRCSQVFVPASEQTICPRCRSATEWQLTICRDCTALYNGETRFCQKCGAAVIKPSDFTAGEMAQELALSVERLSYIQDDIERSNFLGEISRGLSAKKRELAKSELEIVVFYSAILTLHKVVPAQTTALSIIEGVLDLYGKAFVIRGMNLQAAQRLREHYCERFSEYDHAMSQSPDNWMLLVAGKAVENCYGLTKRDLGTATDMVLFIGHNIKVLTDVIGSFLSARAT